MAKLPAKSIKISEKTAKTKRKKAKKERRAKVSTPIDFESFGKRGFYLTEIYAAELAIYNSLVERSATEKALLSKPWKNGNKQLSGFEVFLSEMGPRPFNSYKLKRIDETKPFVKENCQWVKKLALNNVLAFDPGVQNFGVCWLKNRKVVEAFVLNNTLEYVRQDSFDSDVTHCRQELEAVINKRQPKSIVVERFVPRRFSTGSAESINIIIGVLLSICIQRSIPVYLIMSSTWKNALKKHADLDKLYVEAKIALGLKKMVPHTVDASFLGHYFISDRKFDATSVTWFRANMKRLKRA